VFAIDLPAAVVAVDDQSTQDSTPRQARTVLVVDDDPQILTAMGLLLRSWGHETLTASSLGDALAAVQGAGRPPEVALVDMHLSADEDGIQVVHALRQRLGDTVRMAIITGDTSAQVLARIRTAGVVGLHKPVAPESLRRYIDGTLPA
jgi:CheY-like chemotaxis protein